MSVLSSWRETCQKLHEMHLEARRSWSRGEVEVVGEVDGVKVELRYEGSSRNCDYRTVLLDGEMFARECECVPWNLLRDITVDYTCFVDLPLHKARKLAIEAGLEVVSHRSTEENHCWVIEEWYPAENGPLGYFIVCQTLDQVVRLWKLWNAKYKIKLN